MINIRESSLFAELLQCCSISLDLQVDPGLRAISEVLLGEWWSDEGRDVELRISEEKQTLRGQNHYN